MSRPPWIVAVVATLAILLTPTVVLGTSSPANASEGGDPALIKKLDETNRAYIDAQNALTASLERQKNLAAQQAATEPQYAALLEESQSISVAAYQNGGGLRSAATLLNSGTPGMFADRVSTLEVLARERAAQLRQVAVLRAELSKTKATIDAEVAKQQASMAVMTKQKAELEQALAQSKNAVDASTTGSGNTTSKTAEPAPRRADGSWPAESCSVDDPTTKGCLTPRTLHAMQQVQKAGFTHFVSCWRPPGEPYEHPKGRACDFAADVKGFGGVATGSSKEYGTQLAAWLVKNATALGVMYVIWFKQIWTPAAGWRAYTSGQGDPSSDHTNHVHMSIY
ncbi:coiled-coil domain-containing protein [Dactylosporangium cerinum]|uniref:Coiled-coil domain-containing protein n=1 Tax=Dactylosporangium cerinum TaxID=1434730 RepID=A0ABV9WLW7_9ACTN